MYCSTCGSLINAELNYCKRCGARVDKLATIEKPSGLGFASAATGFVGLGGLGLTVGLIAMLLEYGVRSEVVVMITLAFLSAVFGITYSMIQQQSRLAKPAASGNTPEKTNPAHFAANNAAQLEEYREPARRMSVTENTTRTLDKVPSRDN